MRIHLDPLTPNSSRYGRAGTIVFAQNTVKCIFSVVHTQVVQPTPLVLLHTCLPTCLSSCSKNSEDPCNTAEVFIPKTSLPVRFKGREISLLINFFSFCVKKLSLKYFQDLVPSQSKFWKKNCSMIPVAKWSNLGQVSTAPNLNVLCNTCRGTKKCFVAATFC